MKKIKLWIELIFIFIIPLVLLASCFNIKKEYDENGNEVKKSLEFNNIFELSDVNINYSNIIYKYDSINDNDNNSYNEKIFIYTPLQTYWDNIDNEYRYNFTIGRFQTIDLTIEEDDEPSNVYIYFVDLINEDPDMTLLMNVYMPSSELEFEIGAPCYYDYYVNNFYIILDDLIYSFFIENPEGILPSETGIINDKFYIIDNIDSISVSNNEISKVFNNLYSSLGIQDNYILQIIVIYTLLWLIMFIIWHLLYRPLDLIVHILNREKVYEEKM